MTQTNPKDIHRIPYQLTSLHLDINHVRLRHGSYLVENPISLVIQEGGVVVWKHSLLDAACIPGAVDYYRGGNCYELEWKAV